MHNIVTRRIGGLAMETRYFLSDGSQEAKLTGKQKRFILKLIDVFGDFSKKISNAHNVKITDANIDNVSIAASNFQCDAIEKNQRSVFCRDGITEDTSLFHYISRNYYVNIENRNNEVFDVKIIKRTNRLGTSRYWNVDEKVHISRENKPGKCKIFTIVEKDGNEKKFSIHEIDNDESWYDDFLNEVCNL